MERWSGVEDVGGRVLVLVSLAAVLAGLVPTVGDPVAEYEADRERGDGGQDHADGEGLLGVLRQIERLHGRLVVGA